MGADMKKLSSYLWDFWGGAAAMLVALPSAIAFGVTVYAPLGESYAAIGAIAGITGVVVLGIIASILGGAKRLISAPCAPAAAVLSAFVIEYIHKGISTELLVIMLLMVGLMGGLFQILFGLIGIGKAIKYMPYPVVSGYLSGVGLYIIASQTPKFLGLSEENTFLESVITPSLWDYQSILIGSVTIVLMVVIPRFLTFFPSVIVALLGGVASYSILAFFDPSLWILEANPLIIGSIGGGTLGSGIIRVSDSVSQMSINHVILLLTPSLTLAVLLSIDTLKTCVIMDAMTRSNHNPNKELIAQGIGNVSSSLCGGMPGAGTMGATLVNLSSGGIGRLSGVFESILALIAFLALGSLIAWVPISSLAGILIVIGIRMIDLQSFTFLKSSATMLDFLVIVTVVTTALSVSLIMASAVGVVLAILLFVREQIGTTIIHARFHGNEMFSKQVRIQDEVDILKEKGKYTIIYELQGSLFFGTANQLYATLEKDFLHKKYMILDMRRVQSVDLTAAHTLLLIKDIMHDKGGYLILSHLPSKLPTGQDMEAYLDQIGLIRHHSPVKVFADIDDAIEWVEDEILRHEIYPNQDDASLDLGDFEVFEGRNEDTISDIRRLMKRAHYKPNEAVFSIGSEGQDLYFIRRGKVRIVLPIAEQQNFHLRTIGKGNFFGEFGFLEGGERYANAIAETDVDVYILPRESFDEFAKQHHKAAFILMESLAAVLVNRLRITSAELGAHDT